MQRQIYGYTLPDTPAEGYVGYLMAFQDEETVEVVIRPDGEPMGRETAIRIPAAAAQRIARAIMAVYPEARAEPVSATDAAFKPSDTPLAGATPFLPPQLTPGALRVAIDLGRGPVLVSIPPMTPPVTPSAANVR
jgi:hypothetical protein